MFSENLELSRYYFKLSWYLSSYLVAEICHHKETQSFLDTFFNYRDSYLAT